MYKKVVKNKISKSITSIKKSRTRRCFYIENYERRTQDSRKHQRWRDLFILVAFMSPGYASKYYKYNNLT